MNHSALRNACLSSRRPINGVRRLASLATLAAFAAFALPPAAGRAVAADAPAGPGAAPKLEGPALMMKLRDDLSSPLLNTRLATIQTIAKQSEAALLEQYGLIAALKDIAGDRTEFDRLRSEALETLIALREQGIVIADLPDLLLRLIHPATTMGAGAGVDARKKAAEQYNPRVGVKALDLLYRMVVEGDVSQNTGLQNKIRDSLTKVWNYRENDRRSDPLVPPAMLLNRVVEILGAMADASKPTANNSFKKSVIIPFLKKPNKSPLEEALIPGVLGALRNYFIRCPQRSGFYSETPRVLEQLLEAYRPPAAGPAGPAEPAKPVNRFEAAKAGRAAPTPAPAEPAQALDPMAEAALAAVSDDPKVWVRLGVLDVLAVMASKNPGLFAEVREKTAIVPPGADSRERPTYHTAEIIASMRRIKALLLEQLGTSRSDLEIRALVGVFSYAMDQPMIEALLREATPRVDGRPQIHPVTLKAINDALFGALRQMRIYLRDLNPRQRPKEYAETVALVNAIGGHYALLLVSEPAPMPFRLEAAKYLGFWPQEFEGEAVMNALVETLAATQEAALREAIGLSLEYLTNQRFMLINPETLEEAGVDVVAWKSWWDNPANREPFRKS